MSELRPTDPPPRVPRPSHRAEYAGARAAIWALGLLPWRVATALGARLGRLGHSPLGIRRRVAERQIAACFPDLAPDRVREIARRSFESLGRTAIEAALIPTLDRQHVLSLFSQVEGWEYVEAALAAGRGAIVVTGHLGNWELGGAYVAARGIALDAVSRHMSNPLFERLVVQTRERLGMRIVWDADTVRTTPRALRENRIVALLADQGALGLASTYVPFFGRPAKTPRGPAVLALRLRVPLLFATSLRRPDGHFALTFERIPIPDTGDRDRDVTTIVATFTAMLERWVRLHPEQYFWQHRRWRHQPADTPPHLREP